MLASQILLAAFALLSTALASPISESGLNNAERFARGLPPKAPSRRFHSSRTRPALARRSGLSTASTVSAYDGTTLLGGLYMNGWLQLSPTSSTSFIQSSTHGDNGFTLGMSNGDVVLIEGGDLSSTTDLVFYDTGVQNSDTGDARTWRSTHGPSQATSVWNIDSTTGNLYVSWPQTDGSSVIPSFWYSASYNNGEIFAAESAAAVQTATGQSSTTFTQVTLKPN